MQGNMSLGDLYIMFFAFLLILSDMTTDMASFLPCGGPVCSGTATRVSAYFARAAQTPDPVAFTQNQATEVGLC